MIVNSNVNQSNLLMVGMGTSTDTAPATDNKETDGMNFADVLASKQDVNVPGSKVDAVKQAPSKQATDSVSDSRKEQAEDKTVSANTKQDTSGVSENTTTAETVDAAEDIPTDKEIENVTDAILQLLAMLMDQLQLSLEDVQQNLQSLGMKLQDLLTSEGVKDFFLGVQDADTTDLLTDAALNQEFQDFMKDWNQLVDDMNLSLEDVMAMLDSQGAEGFFESMADALISQDQEGITFPQPDTLLKEQPVAEEQQPEVIVAKEQPQTMQQQQPTATQDGQTRQGTDSQTASMPDTDVPEVEQRTDSDFTNPILQNIQDALDRVESFEPQEGVTESRPVVEQVIEQVKVHMSQDTTSMQLQLYPEHLGRIQIHVVSKDGMMTARIAAETEQAKQAIENGLASLKETFEQQDLKVDAVEVMVSTAGFERNDEEHNTPEQEKAGHRSGKLSLTDVEEETEEEDVAEQERMRASGSSVSYSA